MSSISVFLIGNLEIVLHGLTWKNTHTHTHTHTHPEVSPHLFSEEYSQKVVFCLTCCIQLFQIRENMDKASFIITWYLPFSLVIVVNRFFISNIFCFDIFARHLFVGFKAKLIAHINYNTCLAYYSTPKKIAVESVLSDYSSILSYFFSKQYRFLCFRVASSAFVISNTMHVPKQLKHSTYAIIPFFIPQ